MTFESFHSSSNKVVIDSIKDDKNKLLWIAGLKGSGKTHILQATINYMDNGINRLLYLPMRESKDFTPDILDNLDQFDLVAIDDIEYVIGDFSWEEQLLILYEELIHTKSRILISSSDTPQGLSFKLPDLASRFSLGLVDRLKPMNEEQMIEAISLHAKVRGFNLPQDVAKYLISRVPRDVSVLVDIIKLLDYESLSKQRKLTIPFIKTVLDIK
jgi:DnaA family protein